MMVRSIAGVFGAMVVLVGTAAAPAAAAPGEWSRTAPDAAFPDGIEVSPADPDTAYANSGFGGIARTTDGGAAWTHLG
jgi:hypothetical protein